MQCWFLTLQALLRAPVQLVSLLMDGGRLEVPPRERLPGADTPSFAGLDAYVALLK